MLENKNLIVEKQNSEVFLRPRFTIDIEDNYQVILNKFSKSFQDGSKALRGKVVDGHVFISVAKKDEHFWSPQLHLEILRNSDKTSVLKGLFGPKPAVWTLFMFVHFVIGTCFLGFCMLLYSKISLKESTFFPILMMIILPLIWILLYFLGKIGKETGKHQMKKLHDFMITVIRS